MSAGMDTKATGSGRETQLPSELQREALRCLGERFGFEQFKPGQREVVEHLLAGHSAAALFPTGGGKSLCYQLPALLLPGTTLVVSPLIALMKDQIDALAGRGIEAVRLDSTLEDHQYRDAIERLRNGRCRLLYVSPERFKNERFLAFVQTLRVSMFVVDEAHCISEWGHNFRPDYLKLAGLAKSLQAERCLALTATATDKVMADICAAFEIAPERAVRTPFYRENLTLRCSVVTESDRDHTLLQRLTTETRGPTIVYVTLQKTAERVAGLLASRGFPARAYHAGLRTEVREETQNWFLQADDPIIVATIAFGMGIDKPNIRYVYHYNLAKSLENLAQEIGRAGRDGLPSVCETLLCRDDMRTLENFVYGDTPTAASVHALLAQLFAAGSRFSISVYDLSGTHDIRELVVRTLITYLELEGYLEGGTPFYSTYRFQPLMKSNQILAKFAGERREFLNKLFRLGKKLKTWFELDIEQAVRSLGEQRQRIVSAMDYLEQQGMVKLEVAGVRLAYQRVRVPDDLHALGESLHRRMREREWRDLVRIEQVVQLFTQSTCAMQALAQYFDRSLEHPCGKCTTCEQAGSPTVLPPTTDDFSSVFTSELMAKIARVQRASPDVFTDSLVMARLLCGISSPWITRAKLTNHELSGTLAHVPFQFVRTQLETLRPAEVST